jgi:hypothetical protein
MTGYADQLDGVRGQPVDIGYRLFRKSRLPVSEDVVVLDSLPE